MLGPNLFRPFKSCLYAGCAMQGLLKLELCKWGSLLFSQGLLLCKIPATATCFISVLLKQACLETPRPIKGRTCQQHKQPASSSKESPGLGIICVDCPGTEHLFLETGATSVVQQPSQVVLPGLLPVCSAACFYAKPQLLPK